MNYKIEIKPDAPIIWITWNANYDVRVDTPQSTRDQVKILDDTAQPMVVVIDVRPVHLDWDAILHSSNRGMPVEVGNHPNFRGPYIIITTDEAQIAVAKNLDNETFGHFKLDLVATPEEALERAYQLLE